MFLLSLTTPFGDPVVIFTLILLISLFAPILFARVKIPGIIGLILAGMIIGPNVLHWLERDSSIILFGTVGLLYIMFLAGLEIDLNDFKKNRNSSILFGVLTFAIPMAIGTSVAYYYLGLPLNSSILLASMFASHTLLAYPAASRLGITKNRAVNVAVGGTIITDTAALMVLAVIASAARGSLDTTFWLRLSISMALFSAVVLFLFPLIARWFFKNLEGEGVYQYIFVMAVVFLSAFLAELAGVEAIIGAFFAGLALNRLIPHTSSLMNRIEFVGNAIFIPFFLIGVGMLVDLKVLLQGGESLKVAATMTILALSGKWLAAQAMRWISDFKREESAVMFGLSVPQAAATLAAVMVGFQLELFNEAILNGTIVMILITCLIGSLAVDRSGRKLAEEMQSERPEQEFRGERLLVPIAHPNTIEKLITLAMLLRGTKSNEPIYALAIVKDDEEARARVLVATKMLEGAQKLASSADQKVEVVTRLNLNVADGIGHASTELLATSLVVGWNNQFSTGSRLFGTLLDRLLEKNEQMLFVCHQKQPFNTVHRLYVVAGRGAELERGFERWVVSALRLVQELGGKVTFIAPESTLEQIGQVLKRIKSNAAATMESSASPEQFLAANRVGREDLLILISARPGSISYHRSMNRFPKTLAKAYLDRNFILIYPAQLRGDVNPTILRSNLPISDTIEAVSNSVDHIKDLWLRRGRKE